MFRSPEEMFIRDFITFTCLRLDDLVKLQFLILFFSKFSSCRQKRRVLWENKKPPW